jgi:hypothetical protein
MKTDGGLEKYQAACSKKSYSVPLGKDNIDMKPAENNSSSDVKQKQIPILFRWVSLFRKSNSAQIMPSKLYQKHSENSQLTKV